MSPRAACHSQCASPASVRACAPTRDTPRPCPAALWPASPRAGANSAQSHTHARTHSRTHARTHTCLYVGMCVCIPRAAANPAHSHDGTRSYIGVPHGPAPPASAPVVTPLLPAARRGTKSRPESRRHRSTGVRTRRDPARIGRRPSPDPGRKEREGKDGAKGARCEQRHGIR
jgi:hypothetical protein